MPARAGADGGSDPAPLMQLLQVCAGAEEGEWGRGLLGWVVAESLRTGVLQRPPSPAPPPP